MELATLEDITRIEQQIKTLTKLVEGGTAVAEHKGQRYYSAQSLADNLNVSKDFILKKLKGLAAYPLSPKIKRFAEKDVRRWLETHRQDHDPKMKALLNQFDQIHNEA